MLQCPSSYQPQPAIGHQLLFTDYLFTMIYTVLYLQRRFIPYTCGPSAYAVKYYKYVNSDWSTTFFFHQPWSSATFKSEYELIYTK